MKAITMNTGKQTNPYLNKFIIIIILFKHSIMDGLPQNKINKGKTNYRKPI